MTNDILKKKYNAQIFESRYSFHRTVLPLPVMTAIPSNDLHMPIVTEKGVEINLDRVNFELLVKDLEFLENIPVNGIKSQQYAEQVIRREFYERELREKYPALRDAFEKYQTLLGLVDDRKV